MIASKNKTPYTRREDETLTGWARMLHAFGLQRPGRRTQGSLSQLIRRTQRFITLAVFLALCIVAGVAYVSTNHAVHVVGVDSMTNQSFGINWVDLQPAAIAPSPSAAVADAALSSNIPKEPPGFESIAIYTRPQWMSSATALADASSRVKLNPRVVNRPIDSQLALWYRRGTWPAGAPQFSAAMLHQIWTTQKPMQRSQGLYIARINPILWHGQTVGLVGNVENTAVGASGFVHAMIAQMNRNAVEVAIAVVLLALLSYALTYVLLVRPIRFHAEHDALTGIYNQVTLWQLLSRSLEVARTRHQNLALLAFDMDHFKQVNDTFGHAAGDEVLKRLARAITRHVRRTDLVGRTGGEEFVVALPTSSADQAAAIAEQIRADVAQWHIEDRQLSVSIGVATLDDTHAADFHELGEAADQALYWAKEHGRNQVAVWPLPPSEREA